MKKKMLKCPKCGYMFKAPIMDMKIYGWGLTIPGLGVIKCPNCGYVAPRKEFKIKEDANEKYEK